MTKIFVVSDQGTSSGYGRIAAELSNNLIKRGYHVMGASLSYDGLLPAVYDGDLLPYHIGSLQGKPNWPDCIVGMTSAYQPDVIWVIQDAPYSGIVRNMPLDWSKIAFIMTSPVDGAPIHPAWVETAKQADALLTISEFGVRAWAETGVTAGLTRPGINPNKFYKIPDEQRTDIRRKLGITDDAFVLGMMAQHQGRKDIPGTMKAFFDFAKDKPTARLLLDMEPISPAGWDLPAMCKQFGWDVSKLIFRSDCIKKGMTELRDRYNVLDAHAVLAFREGFGLPILEAMACGVVSIAQDWCAGTEVLTDGRGILIPPIDYFMPSTWGGALDKLPDLNVMTDKLQWLHDNREERLAMAKRGMEWARRQTWDIAVDNAVAAIEKAVAKKKPVIAVGGFQSVTEKSIIKAIEPLPQSPDGVAQQVALLEAS